MTGEVHEPCELCGFAESLYELESDITSTAITVSLVVRWAIESLTAKQLTASPPDGSASIASLKKSFDEFEGDSTSTAHHGLHIMAQIGVARAALGLGPVVGKGTVTALHSSMGGVPKPSISSAKITRSGVEGDVQNNRIHHGRPLQALCVWSNDVIEALRGEGHPIFPGMAGENITMSGIDWASLRPGSRLTISGIPVLISSYAKPCSQIADSFADRNFDRVRQAKHKGWSRLYAIPLGEGTIDVGDEVVVP